MPNVTASWSTYLDTSRKFFALLSAAIPGGMGAIAHRPPRAGSCSIANNAMLASTELQEPSMDHLGVGAASAGKSVCPVKIHACKLSALAASSVASKLRIGKGLRTERFDPIVSNALHLFGCRNSYNGL